MVRPVVTETSKIPSGRATTSDLGAGDSGHVTSIAVGRVVELGAAARGGDPFVAVSMLESRHPTPVRRATMATAILETERGPRFIAAMMHRGELGRHCPEGEETLAGLVP